MWSGYQTYSKGSDLVCFGVIPNVDGVVLHQFYPHALTALEKFLNGLHLGEPRHLHIDEVSHPCQQVV